MTTGVFSPAEQQQLAKAPQLIRHLMTIADKGGALLTKRAESKALHKYMEAYKSQSPTVQAIIAAQPEKDEKIEATSEQALKELEQVGALLEAKTEPIHGDAVRDFLMGAADAVAKASREQGALAGSGASPAEEKAIAQIAAALKATDYDKSQRVAVSAAKAQKQAEEAAAQKKAAEEAKAKAEAEAAAKQAGAEAKAKAEAEAAARRAEEEAKAQAQTPAPAQQTLLEQAKARAEAARRAQEKAAEQAQARTEAEAKAKQLAEQLARQREEAAQQADEKHALSQAAALQQKADAMKKEAEALEQQAHALHAAGQEVTTPAAQAAAAPVEIYVVKRGDTLSGIAKALYGNAGRWKEIFEANRNLIKDPNLIKTGWKLRIPRP